MNSLLSALVSRLCGRAREEDGYLIVEMMVGALLLVLISLGTLSAFDGAAKVSATTKSRAIAASVAQEEQERLRTLSIGQLSGLRYTGSKTVGNVVYSITSRADWITDAAGSTSCTQNADGADYLKTTTTVDAPVAGVKPIVLESLVTPPIGTFDATHGSLAVQLWDRSGTTGIANQQVSLTGAANANDTTNANGCAYFGYMTAGNYNVAFSKTGYVDINGVNAVSKSTSVVAQSVQTLPLLYDQAASSTVSFDTKAYSSGTATAVKWTEASFDNGAMQNGRRTFGDGTTMQTSIPATNLFPFTDGYTVFAGDCTGAKPASPPSLTLTAGGNQNLTVRLPSINVTAQRSGSAVSGETVLASPTDAGCTGTVTLGGTGVTTNSSGQIAAPNYPAVPYGNWNVCVDSNFSGVNKKRIVAVNNNNANGTAVTVNVTSSSPSVSGTCP